MDQMEKFLKSTAAIDSDNPSIKEKAQNLIRGKCETTDKAKSLFYWVRDEIKYNPFVPLEVLENYRASKTLERGQGFCVEKAAVLAAFARAVDIPARLHLADIRNYLISDRLLKVMGTNLFSCHGYTELYINGTWVKATPAFDLKVNFIVTGDAVGRHQVEVAGLAGEFEITKAAKQSQINWWLIGGIIAAIILALAIWMLMRWRRFSG